MQILKKQNVSLKNELPLLWTEEDFVSLLVTLTPFCHFSRCGDVSRGAASPVAKLDRVEGKQVCIDRQRVRARRRL